MRKYANEATPSSQRTPESIELTRSNAELSIIQDPKEYSSQDEDDEDNARIHHGAEEEEDTISVAAYDPNERATIAPADSIAPNITSLDVTTEHGKLPAHLNDQLEHWYSRHGRSVPKCVLRRSAGAMADLSLRRNSKEPVTWLHRSGVPLHVAWYELPGWSKSEDSANHSPKLIVVSGPDVAPRIVSYLNTGGYVANIKERGVVYRVWRGVVGDMDGFETAPSVIKISRAKVTRSLKSAPLIVRPRPSSSNVVHMPAIREESERARKPNARYLFESPHAQPSRKRRRSITLLDVEDELSDSTALLNNFMKAPPFKIRDEAPFPSKSMGVKPRYACYLCDITQTERKLVRYHIRKQHSVTTPDESRILPVDAVSVSASVSIPAARRTQPQQEVKPEPGNNAPKVSTPSDFDAHIKNNTALIFFSARNQRVRTRTFAACDTIQKLFAQATAGEVFNREQSRVLEVQLEINGKDEELPIVEDDEQDYNDFVSQLQSSSSWEFVDGRVEGECIVFVVEKRK